MQLVHLVGPVPFAHLLVYSLDLSAASQDEVEVVRLIAMLPQLVAHFQLFISQVFCYLTDVIFFYLALVAEELLPLHQPLQLLDFPIISPVYLFVNDSFPCDLFEDV